MDKSWLYLLSHTLHLVASVYLHEPSFIELKPSDPGLNNEADFGFSIAYQNGIKPNLVIGSPHSDLEGQVYNCPIEDVLKKSDACHKIDINVTNLIPNTVRDTINNEQRFCLGASIAATQQYFLTCAPLWSTIVETTRKSENKTGAFGTCFIYDGKNVTQYKSIVEHQVKLKKKFKNVDSLIGGIGWSTLVDKNNDYILIGKPAVISDILLVNISDPTGIAKSMVGRQRTLFSDVNNIGYALAIGKFFSDTNDTSYYAFSMQDNYGAGKIGFASIISNSLKILVDEKTKSLVTITSPTEGSMFGASLLGVDLNSNDVTDLLVGAPAQVDNDLLYDTGALYIYLDCDTDSVDEYERRTVILASKEGGRFGTAIASNDIDGDGLPEIFVTAPYEDLGVGALYILSGYEVNKMITGSVRQTYLEKVNCQRIQMKKSQTFGFSLQTVDDVDENGCDELAVGSPGSARVMLFRCLPAITATVSTELIEKIVKEEDEDFNVQVCVYVKYPTKPKNIKNKMSVTSNVIGRASLHKSSFEIDLSKREPKYCENFTVQLTFKETGYYTFTTVLKFEEEFLKNEVYDNSWVVLSQYSETERSLTVPRHCDAAVDCTPNLEISTLWNGDKVVQSYILGSTEMVNVTVRVNNIGSATYDGCVRLRIQNGQLYSIGCAWEDDNKKDYKICYLPQPLERGAEYSIQMRLNMTTYTNMDANKTLNVVSYLYDHCNTKNSTFKLYNFNLPLHLNTKNMQVLGSPNSFYVTDVDILNKKSKIQNEHEYKIVNKGLIKWEKVKVVLSIIKTSFTGNYSIYKISSSTAKMECEEPRHTDLIAEFNCKVDLMANSTTKIFAVMDILKDEIESNLKNGMIETFSEFSITLIPTDVTLTKRLSTHIKYQKDMSVGNKKWLIILIAVIVAILILALVAFILYKVGFFKRKQKQRLASFRESVRRQSVKKSTSESNAAKPHCEEDIDMEEMELEVVDCVFDEVPTSSADNGTLIVEEKEHGQK